MTLPFQLHKADGNYSVDRMLFYNHTKCACVAREELQRRALARSEERPRELQNEWQPQTEEPKDMVEKEDESTAPPMMRR